MLWSANCREATIIKTLERERD